MSAAAGLKMVESRFPQSSHSQRPLARSGKRLTLDRKMERRLKYAPPSDPVTRRVMESFR